VVHSPATPRQARERVLRVLAAAVQASTAVGVPGSGALRTGLMEAAAEELALAVKLAAAIEAVKPREAEKVVESPHN